MGYQVLARKWRPHTFHEVVGQQHVLTALINALDQGRLHHAYLFSGTRGVGKTTIARILAKCLNCEQGVSSTPCGQCDSCREIDQGNFVDLLEIDAASRTKVEDTRELLDNVQYRPARGRYKVYLIDEVHMLSRHSFNALLKTLEEPPPYVKFLLATTDPQKLPITILSRCLQFHLKALNREQIVDQLVRVLDAEAQPYELPALAAMAKAADGSMRDALSLTDQALAHGSGHVHLDQVLAMLGTLDHRHLHQMLQLLAQLQGPALMAKVNEVALLGPDFELVHAELASLLHRIALAQLLGASADPLALDSDQVLALAKTFTAEEIQLYYQIALTGRRELPLAPDGRSALEMTLLRMLAFSPRQPGGSAQLQPPSLPAQLAPSPIAGSATVGVTTPMVPWGAVVEASPNEVLVTPPDAMMVATPAEVTSSPAPVPPVEPAAVHDESALRDDAAMEAALFAEQQRLLAEAEQWRDNSEPPAAPTAVESPVGSSPEAAAAGSGLNQLLQVRNRLRSQQAKEQGPSGTAQSRAVLGRTDVPMSRAMPSSAPTSAAAPHPGPAPVAIAPTPAAGRSEPVAAPSEPAALVPSVESSTQATPAPVISDDLPPWEVPPADAYLESMPEPSEGLEQAVADSYAAPEPTHPAPALASTTSLPPAAAPSVARSQPVAPSAMASSTVAPPSMTAPSTVAASSAAPSDERWHSQDLLLGSGDPWSELIATSGVGGRLRQLALHACRQVDGERWILTLPAEHRHLVSDKAIAALSEGFSQHLGQPVQIQIVQGEPATATPAQIEQQRYAQLLAQAQQDLAQDPHIQFLIQRFGAQLDADSILPLKH